MKWTPDQQKAIDARKGTLLVSAAAGSGKTAVLVERVIQRICDNENPCGVENLLIVTFTKAAAAQMKEKISAAISKQIALNPSDKRLRRQQLMLPCASICTIDSFCINLVRENFHALGIAPDFGLLDEGKLNILRSRAVTETVTELYENPSENFMALTELISDKKDDQKLIDAILKLDSLSQAYPFPKIWLRSLAKEFENPKPVEESPWGRILLGYAASLVESCVGSIENCISLLETEPELYACYADTFFADKEMLSAFLKKINTLTWDKISEAYFAIAFDKMKSAPRGYASSVKDICQSTRNSYKKLVTEHEKQFYISSKTHSLDIKSLAPVVSELINAVLSFSERFSQLKSEENGADFSDTLHLALELLIRPAENGFEKTPLAEALSENFAEILVDEYQDVNLAQDMIFSALSKDESNLFMVGDVKQSIYRFRQAMPEIFLARRDNLEEYENGNYPAKVTLGRNFRSRKGITEIVNFIFSAIMSRDAGGLDYDEKERLEAGASYPEINDSATEFHLFETDKEDFLPVQARYVADYIEKAIADGMTVTDGDKQRPVGYKDFCILLRSIKNSSAPFVDELNARGIPVNCEAGSGFLSSAEIMFMISLLKIIDNPANDIPLTAAMLSPVFGFTPDDLALMRAECKTGSFWSCVVSAAKNGNLKAEAFLEKLRSMRRIAATVKSGELIRRLIDDTGYGTIVCAMKNSIQRRANLNLLIDTANRYESSGGKGISGFIAYLDNIIKSGGDINTGASKSEAADAVSVMTIHKSKGLEFPVCFVAACEKTYGDFFNREDLIIASESGIGIKTKDGSAKYETLTRLAAKVETKYAEHSEELRVLYVALTRPKEKLIMLSSCTDSNKTLTSVASKIREAEKADPFTVSELTSYSNCILASLIRHPDAHALRLAAGLDNRIVLACDTPVKADIIKNYQSAESVQTESAHVTPDDKLLSEIKERLGYSYPYAALDGIVAKRIASNPDSDEIKSEYFASRKPAFMSKDKLTPAQRGTATHRFMQFADYESASTDVSTELIKLVSDGMLTQAEADAVDVKSVSAFFSSELAKRILSAEKLCKEYEFTFGIPIREMYPDIPESVAQNEKIIIEGVADCAFVENGELVIVDYKTDRVSSPEELKNLYSEQLSIYRRCLSEVLGLPVKQTLIYSFRLNQSIEV